MSPARLDLCRQSLPAVSLFDISGVETPQTGYHKLSHTAVITPLKTDGPHR